MNKLTEKQRDRFNKKLIQEIKNSELEIKPLKNHRGVKLSQTTSGQRELIREIRNKINEIINWINGYEKECGICQYCRENLNK